MAEAWKNKLFFGDNLTILREHMATESVDLIYLDPPFNSAANYNVLFKEQSGAQSAAQITAFEDTWHWGPEAEGAFRDLRDYAPEDLLNLMTAMRGFLGESDMMAYLTMMAPRLVELHRVLKETGSIYLHCDTTASHYLKLMMDAIFGKNNFRNEIIWKRSYGHGDSKKSMGRSHDSIFLYTKGESYTLNRFFHSHDPSYIESFFRHRDERGRYKLENLTSPNPRPNLTYEYKGYPPPAKGWRVNLKRMQELDADNRLYFPKKIDGRIMKKVYLDELEGQPMTDLWTDIRPLSAHDRERLGYPTQKPEPLLKRIIEASSKEGDIVLDPFCGCGTTVSAAERLRRRWLGIDITHLAISLIKKRLADDFQEQLAPYEVLGVPVDVPSAAALATSGLKGRYDFQYWAVDLAGGRAAQDKKKGKDTGIDGVIYFHDDHSGTPKKLIIQVKSGKVGSPDIRDLKGVMEREHAPLGAFLTLQPATRDMRTEALSAGFYEPSDIFYAGERFPRLQILTIEELLGGVRPHYPDLKFGDATHKRAARRGKHQQSGFDF